MWVSIILQQGIVEASYELNENKNRVRNNNVEGFTYYYSEYLENTVEV
jgi:hypothetical protein